VGDLVWIVAAGQADKQLAKERGLRVVKRKPTGALYQQVGLLPMMPSILDRERLPKQAKAGYLFCNVKMAKNPGKKFAEPTGLLITGLASALL